MSAKREKGFRFPKKLKEIEAFYDARAPFASGTLALQSGKL
jgi:hypothetical protein